MTDACTVELHTCSHHVYSIDVYSDEAIDDTLSYTKCVSVPETVRGKKHNAEAFQNEGLGL